MGHREIHQPIWILGLHHDSESTFSKLTPALQCSHLKPEYRKFVSVDRAHEFHVMLPVIDIINHDPHVRNEHSSTRQAVDTLSASDLKTGDSFGINYVDHGYEGRMDFDIPTLYLHSVS
jgi:hypothetical protein